MAIGFRDQKETAELGLAAYLRFVDRQGVERTDGALFVVNPHGEPIEFCFTGIATSSSSLWRVSDMRRRVVRELSASLFRACSTAPSLILTLAVETPPQVFTEDLVVEVPLCRVSDSAAVVSSPDESSEAFDEMHHLFWAQGPPADHDRVRLLLQALQGRGLLVEPFERAAKGLEEALSRG